MNGFSLSFCNVGEEKEKLSQAQKLLKCFPVKVLIYQPLHRFCTFHKRLTSTRAHLERQGGGRLKAIVYTDHCKNSKDKFLRKLRKLCTDIGVNKIFPFSPSPFLPVRHVMHLRWRYS